MGAARLLAKGWVVFCLFAGAHAIHASLASGGLNNLVQVGFVLGCTLIFTAMGLLFAVGFGASSGAGGMTWLKSLKSHDFLPNFDDWVFLGFVVLSFLNQALFSLRDISVEAALAVERFVQLIVPSQGELDLYILACRVDRGPIFSSSFTWMVAIIYLASALSRLKPQADLVRLQRLRQPELLSPTVLAAVLGLVAVIGIQQLYLGSAYAWLRCSTFADITGALLAGLAPLMLAYVIVAALVALLATGENGHK